MSDSENFARILAEDGATAIMGEHGGIDAIRFADGSAIGWRNPGTADDRETHHGAKLARLVAKAHHDLASLQADTSRSDIWKAEQSARIATDAAVMFANTRAEAEKIAADFAEQDARDAGPPPLEKGDAVAASMDREIRDIVRGMSREEQTALAQELMDGQHPHVLAALLRMPWRLTGALEAALPHAAIAAKLRADPRAYRQRERAVARIEWLREVVEQAQAALPRVQRTVAQERAAAIAARAA